MAAVRQYANARANASSARGIARRIGILHTSFEKFLSGSEPYAKNRGLICAWYLREHRTHPVRPGMAGGGEPVHDPEAHVEALLRELRGDAQTEARLRITGALAQGYRRMGLPDPGWLYGRR
jgi:hypothetical protein